MARYINADELYKATQKRIAEANEARMAVVDDEFLDLINDAFTEDVAPRAEVAEELINMALSKIQIMISAIKAQEGNGIITEFNGGAKTALEIVFKDLTQLKKKYTDARAAERKQKIKERIKRNGKQKLSRLPEHQGYSASP